MNDEGSTSGGEPNRDPSPAQSGWSAATQWSLILRAGAGQSSEALEQLCGRYWHPVYVYLRRRGYETAHAEDLTQTFISSFVVSPILSDLDASKGRFRSYLLVCLKNFLANEWNRAKAEKRGGGRACVSLDEISENERICAVAPDLSPDELYDRRCAMAMLDRAMRRLEEEELKAGRGVAFKRLQGFLTVDEANGNYTAAGADLGMTREAVAMAVLRLRRRFGDAFRAEVAATLADPAQVDEEMNALFAALRRR